MACAGRVAARAARSFVASSGGLLKALRVVELRAFRVVLEGFKVNSQRFCGLSDVFFEGFFRPSGPAVKAPAVNETISFFLSTCKLHPNRAAI